MSEYAFRWCGACRLETEHEKVAEEERAPVSGEYYARHVWRCCNVKEHAAKIRELAEHPARRVVDALLSARFACTDEDELQRAVAAVLDNRGIFYEREKVLLRRDRVDFLTVDGVAIELKVSCTPKELLRQVTRYAEAYDVRAIVVGSTDYKALKLPSSVLGKPLFVVQLRGW